MKLSRRTLLSTPLAVVAPVGEMADSKWLSIRVVPTASRAVYAAEQVQLFIDGVKFAGVESIEIREE